MKPMKGIIMTLETIATIATIAWIVFTIYGLVRAEQIYRSFDN